MPSKTFTAPLLLHSVERRRRLSQLSDAAYKGKRLAALRRALSAILVVIGAPVIALAQASNPTLRHMVAGASVMWLVFALPMIRVLYLERRNRLEIERLQAALYPPASFGERLEVTDDHQRAA
jgi:hypothetical protein